WGPTGASGWPTKLSANFFSGTILCGSTRRHHPNRAPTDVHRPGGAPSPGPRQLRDDTNVARRTFVSGDGFLLGLGDLCILPLMTSARRGARRATRAAGSVSQPASTHPPPRFRHPLQVEHSLRAPRSPSSSVE